MEESVRLPEAFACRMKKLLGEEYPLFLASYQNPRAQGLRLNGLKGETGELKKVCGSYFRLEPVPWAKDGFFYAKEERPGKHPYHEAGLYYMQEPSAMAVVEALNVQPGDKVLDLCAAPGGKSTQIASRLQGQGLLISNEIHPARAKILSQNIERMGAANVAVTNHDAQTMAQWLPEFFDKIVVDAPCSGEGMFRKDPEARNEWAPDSPRQCSLRQQKILDEAALMLKPGGRLVYATCTFAPEENEGTLEVFLQKHPEFFIEDSAKETPGFAGFGQGKPEWIPGGGRKELESAFRLWPHQIHGEGHFLAVLGKKMVEKNAVENEMMGNEVVGNETVGNGSVGKNRAESFAGCKKSNKKKEKEKREKNTKKGMGKLENREMEQIFVRFCQEVFYPGNKKEPDKLWDREAKDSRGRLILFGEQLYHVPEELPDIRSKKVLRPGLHLGSFKKNRFEPSHALALYLKKEQVKQWVNLESKGEWTARYLKGETLPVEEEISAGIEKSGNFMTSGWVLVMVDGYSLGWAKLAGGRLQNHYPRGLRWG